MFHFRRTRRALTPKVAVGPVVLSALIAVLGALLAVVRPAILDEYLETLLLDYRFRLRNALRPPGRPEGAVIVAVDERSLAAHGRWPWPRELQARLIRQVCAAGPTAVGVDIFFPEPESPAADAVLAQALCGCRDRLVVALGFEVVGGLRHHGEIEGLLYDQAIQHIDRLSQVHAIPAVRALVPPEPIARSANFAHVYTLSDRDGHTRMESLYLQFGDEFFPSLALVTARIAMGLPADEVRIVGGAGVRLGGLLIPTDDYGRLQVNYFGREGSIAYVSATDVLAGQTPPQALAGKTVFIGTSAIATYDLITTPFSANMPGVEKNATVLLNILNRDFITRAPLFVDLLNVLAPGLLVAILCSRMKARRAILLFLAVLVVLIAGNQAAFGWLRLRVGLSYALLSLVLEGIVLFSWRHLREERRSREIRRMFSSYVTEKVVDEIISNPDLARVGGQRKEVSVLFADIRGFTSYAERSEPEHVVAALNEYLGAMTEAVFRWEGTLDKFFGDGIMAYWGAPLAQANHAELAVRCALDMRRRMDKLRQKWRREGKEALDNGIGVNTGCAIVGNIGVEGRKIEYTVIGDTINLCSRIEAVTREYDCRIVITESTRQRVASLLEGGDLREVRVERLPVVTVRGRGQSVEVFALSDPTAEAPA
jgi:adenylate cyclase